MDEIDGPALPRLLALLVEAQRHAAAMRADSRAGAAGFVLGAALGLVLGRTDPDWAAAALDELAWTLAAEDGRSPAAHQSDLWAAARRVIDQAAALDADERG